MKIRTYSELCQYKTLLDRFNYLKLGGVVGDDTFGFDRWINQQFYRSKEWKEVRDKVKSRDLGCEMGLEDHPISGLIYVHHMNPITKKDIDIKIDFLLNPEYLICVSKRLHDAIHFGDEKLLPEPFVERTKNDTAPWLL